MSNSELERAWQDGFLAGKNSVPKPIERHLKRREVEELTGLSRSSIYDMMSRGEFPRPIRMGSRSVAWPESRLARWIEKRPDATNADMMEAK